MLIVQLSDLHVRPEGVLYQGVVDSNAMLADAIRHVNALDPQPDVVLLTGDLVDTGIADEYRALRRLLTPLRAPFVAIPGNHDDRAGFRAAFADWSWMPADGPIHYVVDGHGPVRLVALDVTVPGLHHGNAGPEAMVWLEATLASEPDRPTVIMMHQPPFACGVPYLDAYLCHGGATLAAVVARYPAVERIVCGHVHRLMQLRFGGTLLCTAPSTTTSIDLQLRPDAKPQSHLEPPACLIHQWRPETGLITHLSLIGTFAGPFPFA